MNKVLSSQTTIDDVVKCTHQIKNEDAKQSLQVKCHGAQFTGNDDSCNNEEEEALYQNLRLPGFGELSEEESDEVVDFETSYQTNDSIPVRPFKIIQAIAELDLVEEDESSEEDGSDESDIEIDHELPKLMLSNGMETPETWVIDGESSANHNGLHDLEDLTIRNRRQNRNVPVNFP